KLLGDDARQPIYVETIAKRGYRFIANVEEVLTDDGVGEITERFDGSDLQAAGERKSFETDADTRQGQPSMALAETQDQAAAGSTSPGAADEGKSSAMQHAHFPEAGPGFSARRAPVTVEDAASRIRKSGKRKIILFAGLLMLLAAVGAVLFLVPRSPSSNRGNGNFQRVKFKGLTVVGTASAAAISPDGKFISYVVSEN